MLGGMKTASIGRRFGDWLGVVPEEPEAQAAPRRLDAVSPDDRAPRAIDEPSDAATWSQSREVTSFRDVVNQRRHLSD
jgi:hypothetical protein